MNFLSYIMAVMTSANLSTETAEKTAEMFFKPSKFLDMLSYMGIGMFVIFVLIGIIILVTVLINKIFSGSQK